MADPREVYAAAFAERTARHQELRRRVSRASWLRLATIALLILAVWLVIQYTIPPASLVVPIAVFIALVAWQSGLDRAAELARRATVFYERGLARLENRWQGGGEPGDRFLDSHHPYAADLDIFGRGSLFELLSIARTRSGEARLASWLTAPASIEELRERQAAVEELRPLLEFRESLAVLGDDVRSAIHPEHLAQWAAAPARPFPPAFRIAALLLAAAQAAMLLWWTATLYVEIPPRIGVILVGLIEGGFALMLRTRILEALSAIHEPAHELDLLSQILAVIEQREFQSARLRRLRDQIRSSDMPASAAIGRLHRWMELADSRDNVFLRIFGPPLLWSTQIGMAVENWRARHGSGVPRWIDAVAEFEALCSLAGYASEHPEDPWPEFESDTCFEAEEIGHPLLARDRCVRNPVTLHAPIRLIVVSGSNMSGKSTLLRAAGINAVLALAGAPVCAKRLRLSYLSVGASIRTMDSLEEGHSRFMAEILRLKQILELPRPALFLLDELLHGTNSHDRSIGAAGLVRALIGRGSIGVTTTHDLSLARVADELAPAAINVHFEDRIENGNLLFDYRMRPGVVARSNALDLMRTVGIDV
jgi:hypothetical protein